MNYEQEEARLKKYIPELLDVSTDLYARTFIPFIVFDVEKARKDAKKLKEILTKMVG